MEFGSPETLKGCIRLCRKHLAVEEVEEKKKEDEEEKGKDVESVRKDIDLFQKKYDLDLLRFKAEKYYEAGDYESAGRAALYYQGGTLRFLALTQYDRRLRTMKKPEEEEKDMFAEDEEWGSEETEKLKALKTKDSELPSRLHNLPSNWRILQINLRVSRVGRFPRSKRDEPEDDNVGLFLTRASSEEGVHSLRLPPPRHDPEMGPTILKEFHVIITTYTTLYKAVKDYSRQKFTDMRKDLEARLSSLVQTIQTEWLQHGASWMLGLPIDNERVSLLSRVSEELLGSRDDKRAFYGVMGLLDAADQLKEVDICKGLKDFTGDSIAKLSQILDFGKQFPGALLKRHPILLILGSDIQQLPWDSLPILRNNPVTRVPSLNFLFALYETHKRSGTSVLKSNKLSKSIYYVLNPDKSLERTQERLEPFFKEELGIEGLSGEHPSFPALRDALNSRECFMYCGHGSSLKNLSLQKLESMNVRAMPLLFGCRSGKLEKLGKRYDPMGTANSYMVAASPAMLGFLWSVTDKDVDEWTASFLRFWYDDSNRNLGLVEAVAMRKERFQSFINGAAAVTYGLPSLK